MDSDLGDLKLESLLNSDAAKHRMSIKPKKNYSTSPQRPLPQPDEKYVKYVRNGYMYLRNVLN